MASTGQFVSASAMARHLCFERAMLDKLLVQGVVERQSDGRYELDSTRAAYIRHLRAEKRASPRTVADAGFVRAKTRLVDLRYAQQSGQLMHTDEAVDVVERLMGLFTSGLSNLVARVSRGDRGLKQRLEDAVFDIRNALADQAEKLAKADEPEAAA
jgi:hypothetical protein